MSQEDEMLPEGQAWPDDEGAAAADEPTQIEPTERAPSGGNGRTCVSCRKSKVKCNRGFPCSRCVRLGLACVATGPPVRGARRKARTPAAAQARLGEDARGFLLGSMAAGASSLNGAGDMPSIEQLIAGNMEHRITQPAESSGDSKESVLILVRNWFAIALRRRSTDLLGKCFTLATQAGISLDALLIGDESLQAMTTGQADVLPVMDFVKDILFVPGPKQDVLGEPFPVESIPSALTKSALFPSGRSPSTEIVFATCRTHKGLLSLYCSPPFEREIAAKSDIESAYLENAKPMLEFMFPSDEIEKVSRIVGVLFRTLSSQEAPPVVSVRTRTLRRSGGVMPVSLYIGLVHVPTGEDEYSTYAIYRFSREDAPGSDSTDPVESPEAQSSEAVAARAAPATAPKYQELPPGEHRGGRSASGVPSVQASMPMHPRGAYGAYPSPGGYYGMPNARQASGAGPATMTQPRGGYSYMELPRGSGLAALAQAGQASLRAPYGYQPMMYGGPVGGMPMPPAMHPMAMQQIPMGVPSCAFRPPMPAVPRGSSNAPTVADGRSYYHWQTAGPARAHTVRAPEGEKRPHAAVSAAKPPEDGQAVNARSAKRPRVKSED